MGLDVMRGNQRREMLGLEEQRSEWNEESKVGMCNEKEERYRGGDVRGKKYSIK